MLLAVYGLRSGEARSLRLEDIDWEYDRLRVCRSKARRTQTFPLPATVANSILRYPPRGTATVRVSRGFTDTAQPPSSSWQQRRV